MSRYGIKAANKPFCMIITYHYLLNFTINHKAWTRCLNLTFNNIPGVAFVEIGPHSPLGEPR